MTQSIHRRIPNHEAKQSFNLLANASLRLSPQYFRNLDLLSSSDDYQRVIRRLTSMKVPQENIHINFQDSTATITSDVFTIRTLQSKMPQNWEVIEGKDDATGKFIVKINDPDNLKVL